MKTPLLLILLFILNSYISFSQTEISRIEPPNWWVGMKNPNLTLMIYGENISNFNISTKKEGVEIKEVKKVRNNNYLFVDITIDENTIPGEFDFNLTEGGKIIGSHPYSLLKRKEDSDKRKGFDSSDIIYLIMPDRFANGDKENDSVKHLYEKSDRNNPDGRHGGDIQGIYNNIDYIKELGATAIWLNPVFENNQKKFSYHGYSITDFYNIDARFGNLDDYISLVDKCHKNKIKIIKDMIFNHCGSEHWWMDDLPDDNWIHTFPEFTRSNFRAGVIVDPYASKSDEVKMLNGWFDTTMPDLNQSHPLLKNYLIQNSIWWIEKTGIDGIRMDTQPYPDKDMMSEWANRIHTEYPDFKILGEVWVNDQAISSYWFNNWSDDSYKSGLNSIFDFPLNHSIKTGMNEPEGWSTGIIKLYDALTKDYLYKDPSQITIFGDNHDVERLYSLVGEDYGKFKTVFTFLMTTRGIPMIYYGTEILMTGQEHLGHKDLRKDFPGGWTNDSKNAFNRKNLNSSETEALIFVKSLMNWRNNTPVVHSGHLTHFVPEEGIYVYFRHNNEKSIMIILNNRDSNFTLDTSRFSDFIGEGKSAKNIFTNESLENIQEIKVLPKEPIILELN